MIVPALLRVSSSAVDSGKRRRKHLSEVGERLIVHHLEYLRIGSGRSLISVLRGSRLCKILALQEACKQQLSVLG